MLTYEQSGVNIDEGNRAVSLIKNKIKETYDKNVIGDLGNFSGLYSLKDFLTMKEPVLLAATDGVGTKLKLAQMMNKHNTVGIDLVAMSVNDLICQGAKPLLFLDYIAIGKLVPEHIDEIVKGVADGCKMSGCALIGGETAEMPGFYPVDEYDVAGFSVGIVDKKKIIDGSKLTAGDVLIGLPSSGVHSNGFSLVRKVFGIDENTIHNEYPELDKPLGETLLTPTKIYVKPILDLISKVDVKAISHITGGGFYENIPRMLSDGLTAKIKKDAVPVLPIFKVIQRVGNIPEHDMFNTFNMGIGMIVAVAKENADKAVETLKAYGEDAVVLGELVEGNDGVIFE
ncbi:MAG: phosphoribosylformylglycinamidine cyclo-ligase [Clostridiales bacterium]|uniref:phosphoribosylformylglycinamidine cyclo-ligase n=1 Tax=Terrisporobacter sp. TaxID=1965305 RepID=UPI002A547A4A|nr:phosphoribosylformylglycinamidine cyclo-ligase [Terrisporobacter sp.]MDD7753133.1 phosphoribosylformylglycinamidine cyclo-ligase [Clostridiales bacterium]MDY4135428.1 phosphoribosylformylglycinamidine cyclo-ligase [Terrisporobacter sp.]